MSKQVIVVRKDLKMRRGKECAQAAHASMAFLSRRLQKHIDGPVMHLLKKQEWDWINGSFKKVCLQVNSEEELKEIYEKAKEAGLEAHLIEDSGLTEFGGVVTPTCVGIGPDLPEKIDPITGHLKLY